MTCEVWGKYPQDKRYWVSIFGNIKGPRKDLKLGLSNTGYLVAYIGGKTRAVHRVVIETFYGKKEGYYVNHKDGNKQNNDISNLEWVTASYNNKHAYSTGLKSNKGENQSRHKLKEKDVLEIRLLRSQGTPNKVLAEVYCVGVSTIKDIYNNRTWSHI